MVLSVIFFFINFLNMRVPPSLFRLLKYYNLISVQLSTILSHSIPALNKQRKKLYQSRIRYSLKVDKLFLQSSY